MKILTKTTLIASLCLGLSGSMQAGSIFLTGHDIDLHNNADGSSTVILDWLRGAGTASAISAATYKVGALRTSGGGTFNAPPGFTVDVRDPASFADGAAFAAWLGTISVLEIASHTSCGGCSLTTAGSNLINGFAPQITNFFNAGGDIWANTGASLGTFYNFLPASAVATGAAISGSSGFVPTAAGAAIGITDVMVNGDQTHNRFTSFAPAFTVFEVRPNASLPGGNEIISIGIRDGAIDGGVITGPGGGAVPEPATLSMVAGAIGFLVLRRRRMN